MERSCKQHTFCRALSKQGPWLPPPQASVKAPCTLKHGEVSLNTPYCPLHGELDHYPATQTGMLKPTEVKGLD